MTGTSSKLPSEGWRAEKGARWSSTVALKVISSSPKYWGEEVRSPDFPEAKSGQSLELWRLQELIYAKLSN